MLKDIAIQENFHDMFRDEGYNPIDHTAAATKNMGIVLVHNSLLPLVAFQQMAHGDHQQQ